jgi:hypothetical protein
MNFQAIAVSIVDSLKQNSSPGASTWGDKYPDAHRELFGYYYNDLIDDVASTLRKQGKPGALTSRTAKSGR